MLLMLLQQNRAMARNILFLVLLFLQGSRNGVLGDSSWHHRFRRGRHGDPLTFSSAPPSSSFAGPSVFFEVARPVGEPSSSSGLCSLLVMQHSFASTYDLPPATANYTPPPPSRCGSSWDQVVLVWSGTCRGRQYDRISGVWFGGVEILRTCTAEPTSAGISWEVRKDVTRFSSVFKQPQLVVVELANVVDATYTGIFNINITLEFYKSRRNKPSPFPPGTDGPADVVLPISLPDPLSYGHWFQISSENDTSSRTFAAPTNVYRAVLEVCVSFHGNDEFWYTNPPNEYLEANGLSGYPGNGPFREVQVYLDGALVGAVWPFPVIFTGGINPLLWRPAAAIGAFNLPSYDVELTPFVGLLVDGDNHTISLRVENAVGSWPLDANLHLWLDPHTSQTTGGLLSYFVSPASPLLDANFSGLDGTFHTTVERSIFYSGYIICSLGNIYATSSYSFMFDNVLEFQNASAIEIVSQGIQTTGEVIIKTPSKVVFSQEVVSSFPFYLYCLDASEGDSSYVEKCNLNHSFNQQFSMVSPVLSSFSSLRNSQVAEGWMEVSGSTVTAGEGALEQVYDFESTGGCYAQSLSTRNYSIIFDMTDFSCHMYTAEY